jgi:predicted AlkP superfamily pyrophosphatase or phosphodiesterase
MWRARRLTVSGRRLAVLLLGALLASALAVAARGAAQEPRPLLLVISIDGLRPDYVLAADTHQARIPNLRRLLSDGAYADAVEGVIPTVTYPSHTTLVTGVWPTVHGIAANTTFDPQRENQGGYYWYAEDIRVPTLWDVARQAGMTTASIQWPATVGAGITWNIPEMWRSNAPDDAKLIRAVATPGLLAELEPALGSYPRALDVDADERRARYAARILETKRPGLMLLHLIAFDAIQHELGPGTREAIAVLERLDALVGVLRAAAERAAPGRATVAVVSDHGFARTDAELNLFAAFRAAGLFAVDGQERITDWKAMPWTAGGSIAVVLKDPADAAARDQVRQLLTALASDPANGIDRVLDADALHRRGGFPTASFLVGLRPAWRAGSRLTGPVQSAGKTLGTHGHLPDLPEMRASFFVVGPGVPAGRALGRIDMRDIAPTLARRLGLALPAAAGRVLVP